MPEAIHSQPGRRSCPFELGRRLYEAAPEPKQFYEVQGAPHNSTYIVGGKAVFRRLAPFHRVLSRELKADPTTGPSRLKDEAPE